MDEPVFLTIDEVIVLHEISLDEHGGAEGIRDRGAFESAVTQPLNDYWYGNADLFGIAAAYAFHIAEAQAFLDGNKRTAMAAGLAFLELNGVSTTTNTLVLYDAMIAIAKHELDKPGLAAVLRQLFGK
jgi:death-on-curing protein